MSFLAGRLKTERAARAVLSFVGWLTLCGCGAELVDRSYDGPPFLTLTGAVDVEPADAEDAPGAAVAWFWLTGSEATAAAWQVEWEPRVYSYSMTLRSPPGRDDFEETGWSGGPVALPSDVTLLVGLPLLIAGATDDAAEEPLAVDPELGRLIEWLADPSGDARALVQSEDGMQRVIGVTRHHLLVAVGADEGVETLGEHPAWSDALPTLAEATPGLTLYAWQERSAVWAALAEPGVRTEFQGIDITPPANL